MEFQISFKVNDKIFLRDPEGSEIGKQIVKHAINQMYLLGFDHFTFKKLATEMKTTEATIYRYFENKHRILLYILNWYWSYMEFLVIFQIKNLTEPEQKINSIIGLLSQDFDFSAGGSEYNMQYLNNIVVAESSKVYLVKDISEINKMEVFKSYKDLCATISEVILELNPNYKFPKSLSSTLIETSHNQQFFSKNLPKLTDIQSVDSSNYTREYLLDLVFKVLK